MIRADDTAASPQRLAARASIAVVSVSVIDTGALVLRDWQATHGALERNRLLTALDANGWRRKDTAQYLGISRKVLWEKIRKYQIFDEEPGTGESE